MNPTTDRVPTTALTVTLARVALAWVVNALGEHATVVPDVHDAVPQRMSPEWVAVGVKLYAPKFSPLIVTVPDPERIVFFGAGALNTGAAPVHP